MKPRNCRLLYPEGRRGATSYVVEACDTPKGLYVGRQHASHGSLIRWSVMRAALKRAQAKGWTR